MTRKSSQRPTPRQRPETEPVRAMTERSAKSGQSPNGVRLYSVQEAAELVGLCRETIYRAIRVGELAKVPWGRRSIRIREECLDAWLRSDAPESPTIASKPSPALLSQTVAPIGARARDFVDRLLKQGA